MQLVNSSLRLFFAEEIFLLDLHNRQAILRAREFKVFTLPANVCFLYQNIQ